MLQSLGSHIGLPFLSQEQDARLEFRTGRNGITRLSKDPIEIDEQAYWSQYWTLFSSAADVDSLVTLTDIRTALHACPRNIANLITVIGAHLDSLLASPAGFSSTETSTSTSTLTSSWSRTLTNAGNVVTGGGSHTPPSACQEVLVCLRVLERVLPVVYERAAIVVSSSTVAQRNVESSGQELTDQQLHQDFAWHVLWRPRLTTIKYRADADSGPTSCACFLLRLALDLLFIPGFTITSDEPSPPDSAHEDGSPAQYKIWTSGIGCTYTAPSSPTEDRNKAHVLRFLLVLLSGPIYQSPQALFDSAPTKPPIFPHEILLASSTLSDGSVSLLPRELTLTLLCSLLNTSLSSSGQTNRWGAKIPYNHFLITSGHDRQALVRTSFLVLILILDSWAPRDQDGDNDGDQSQTRQGKERDVDPFKFFICKLHRTEDFEFISTGILQILSDDASIRQGILPGAQRSVTYLMETYMLFWKLIELNPRFRDYTYSSDQATRLIVYMILSCLDIKDDPAQYGLLRLLFSIIQDMSADPLFHKAVNQAMPDNLVVPTKWAIQGTVADFLIVSLSSVTSQRSLDSTPTSSSLYPALTITLANMAPFLRHLGIQAAHKIGQLFKHMASPGFLLADESHPRLLYYLLEVFNGVVFHSLRDNPNLVYTILQSHRDIQNLATFTLVGGLRDFHRQQQAATATAAACNTSHAEKRSLDSDTKPPIDPLDTPTTISHESASSPPSDKAKGKQRERIDRPAHDREDLPREAPLTPAEHDQLMKLAEAGVGPFGYVPTQAWVTSWQTGLPLDSLLVVIAQLLPRLEEIQPSSASTTNIPSGAAITYLTSVSVDTVQPRPSPPSPRRFQWTLASRTWFTSLLWAQVYTALIPTFAHSNVRLFGVKQAGPSRREQALQSVSNRFFSMVGGEAKA